MDKCPAHDFPETDDLRVILDRIDDPSLIINLACDFANHVRNMTPNPLDTDKWLLAVRRSCADQASAGLDVLENAEEAIKASRIAVDTAVGPAFYAAGAVSYAAQTIVQPTSARAIDIANDAALQAVMAVTTDAAERAEHKWQIRHTRKRACTCLVLEPAPPGARSRNSLLAG